MVPCSRAVWCCSQSAFENFDEDAFTDKVREFDEISRLDAQKTSLLLEIKNKIKESAVDIT